MVVPSNETLGPPRPKTGQGSEDKGFRRWNEQSWYLVTGTIERNKATAGSRHALFRLASGGHYPKGMEPTAAFAVGKHPIETTKRLLSISVVFSDERSANSFIVNVDKYIVSTHGVDYHTGIKFSSQQVEPNKDRLVLESDYVPNQADGEAPQDSPVWDVEVSAMDISALSPTTIYSRSDTVFKYQRIEADAAFARTDPEGAHIFPHAKCKGLYEWLDKADFNRLALSRDGHKNFDGTANGQGVHAATCALVALEPSTTSDVLLDHVTVTRISNRLWCRSKSVAKSWRPFLQAEIKSGAEGEHICYEPIHLYCERNRTVVLKFEQQQESDGTFDDVCVTAIPGVDDPRTLSSWNDLERTVAVSEVMVCLLRWNYAETRRIWADTP